MHLLSLWRSVLGDSSVIHCLSSQHNNPYLTEILPHLTTTLLTILFFERCQLHVVLFQQVFSKKKPS